MRTGSTRQHRDWARATHTERDETTEREFDLPGGTNVALWVVPNVEHFDFENRRNHHPDAKEPPDVNDYSWREYGTRVRIWRIMDILDEYDIRATVALNADVRLTTGSEIIDHYKQQLE